MLEVESINTYYGKSHVLHNLSLRVDAGEIVSLIGRNGVGKTTTFRSIIGIAPPETGVIRYVGEEIQGLKPHQIARKRISFIPEDRRIFPNLNVRENLIMGLLGSNIRGSEAKKIDEIYEEFPTLRKRESHLGRNLSGGEQQMLAIGRSLISDPKLMLIDEPTEGLMPLMVEKITEVLLDINKKGVTILLVEQRLSVSLGISDRAYIMQKGIIVAQGRSNELRRDESALKFLSVGG